MELFAIVRLDTNKLVWAKCTTPVQAEITSVSMTISYGAVSLLSGQELIDYLVDNLDDMSGHHGSPQNVYGDLDVTL